MSGFFPFGDVPPEFIARMQEAQDHMHMHVQDNTHAVKQLLDELTADQLATLDLVFANCVNDVRNVTYFRGRIEAVRQLKFGICPCGEDHNPDDLLGEQKVDQTPLPQQVAPVVPEPPSQDDSPKDYMALCILYNVSPIEDNKVTCNGCDQEYVSLEDRMVKAPGIEGCDSCIQKQKWG